MRPQTQTVVSGRPAVSTLRPQRRLADSRPRHFLYHQTKKVWIVCSAMSDWTLGCARVGSARLQLTRLGKLHINEIGCYLIAALPPRHGIAGTERLSVTNNDSVVRGIAVTNNGTNLHASILPPPSLN